MQVYCQPKNIFKIENNGQEWKSCKLACYGARN